MYDIYFLIKPQIIVSFKHSNIVKKIAKMCAKIAKMWTKFA